MEAGTRPGISLLSSKYLMTLVINIAASGAKIRNNKINKAICDNQSDKNA